jgi:predicted DNA-binding transcriptional regulator AlpA
MIEWRVSVDYPDTSVSMTVWAPTLREATDLAYQRLSDPGPARPIGLRVEGTPPLARELVDTAGVRAMLGGISQHRLARLRSEPDFPAPIQRYGGGRGIWARASIEEYVARAIDRSTVPADSA